MAYSDKQLARIQRLVQAGVEYSTALAMADSVAQADLDTQTGPPSYATSKNRYDPARNIYNWKASNTRKLRASLGRAQSGTGLADHAFFGDSETDRYIGTGNDYLNMWPRVYRSVLASLGIPVGGSGFVRAAATSASNDPRWTFTGTWASSNTFASIAASGATATFTSTDPGTTLQFVYYGTSAPFTITVDGAAPANGSVTVTSGTYSAGTVTPAGGLILIKLTVTGLSNAVHTFVLTTTSASTTYVLGADLYGASGLLVHNFGIYGTTAQLVAASISSGITGAIPSFGGAISTPDVVHIALGVNDISVPRTPAQVAADMTSIANAFPNSDKVIYAQYQPAGTTQAGWEAQVAALYGVADTLDVPLVDLYDRSGGWNTAVSNGLMGDAVHPNAAAQRDWGRNCALAAAS